MTSPTTDRRFGLVGNMAIKSPVTVVAVTNVTQSGQQTIDGVVLLALNAAGVADRVLCTGQTDASQNGIWDVSASAWTRSLDANGKYDLQCGSIVVANFGTTYSNTFWKLITPNPIAIAATALIWSQVLAVTGSLGAIEVQTAAAGQTVFNLSELTYYPGTNSLQVYVNGFRFLPSEYIETSGSSVTIVTALELGDQAMFAASVPQGSSSSGSSNYTPAGASPVTTTVQSRLRAARKTPEENGAAADGVTDDTAAIQRAIDCLESSGAELLTLDLSAKPYFVAGTLTISKAIRVMGQGVRDFDNTRPITRPDAGSWLIHGSLTGPLFQISGDATNGALLTDFGVFQTGHDDPAPGWVPTVHDWVIRAEGTHGTLKIKGVHFHNVYQGVLCVNSARPVFENITGQFFLHAVSFDQIFDVGHLDGLHAWTYWSEDTGVLQWQQANGASIVLERVDGMHIDNIFTFAQAISVYCGASPTATGAARVINIGSLYSDFCGRALVIDRAVCHVTIDALFHLGQAWPGSPVAALPGACGVHITSVSHNSNLQIGNYYDVLAEDSSIKLEGDNDQVWISSPIIEQFDKAGTGAAAVASTTTSICHFGNTPSQTTYLGAVGPYISGSGIVFRPLMQQSVAGNNANKVIAATAAAGQLAVLSAQGEVAAGLTVIAATTGTLNIGSSINPLSFYGHAAVTQQTGVTATSTSIFAALQALGLITT